MTLEVALAATYVGRMKETAIMEINVRKVTYVELTIAELYLENILNLIVAILKMKIFAQLRIHVEWIKVIVIHIMYVQMDFCVD